MMVKVESVFSPGGQPHTRFDDYDVNNHNHVQIEHDGVTYRLHVDASGNLVLAAYGGLVIRAYGYYQVALGAPKVPRE